MTTAWIADFLDQLEARGIPAREAPAPGLAPARLVQVDAADWGRLAHAARDFECRWVAGWGEDGGDDLLVNACFEKDGAYLVARAAVKRAAPTLPSHAPYYPAADRPERHTRDMLGIVFHDHPDARRWTRHQAWKDTEYPLRQDFPVAGNRPAQTPPDDGYGFLRAQGAGVYEIPVGPVHAGIIEPGHFRFQAVGEMVLNLEERLGYVHKGIEKIAAGRDAAGLARLAGRVSGDSTVAHAWAACMALERAAGVKPPPRAIGLRALMAERERVANHLGDIGAICNDVSFTFGFYQFGRLREEWTRLSRSAFGHRFMMDRVIPGGVAADLDVQAAAAMERQIVSLRNELGGLFNILDDLPSLEDRLDTTGYLDPATAKALGALGYVGHASGVAFDVRRDAAYPPYDTLKVEAPVFKYGDVAARVKVRARETLASLNIIETLLARLPEGPIGAAWKAPAAGAEGLGLTEGFRGECLAYVRFDENGRIARYFPRDPSWLTWPALEILIRDNIVPDFPVCNKSVNGSYSGHDL
ncbi:MAG: hydrogenase [Candidatus Muproteobacteria bacterium RIFCSPHIGHO2_02_FULL_65_16]|uniref:Hydrogenase n=1 Tax=Candidatus Muproteobacteria bacterium RIFCSPHIGHO2_02_FULL_65_16 TaxID=1817766 RepID=A0A1F6U4P2_9PROT|nr:MAG: hydrogenase [Candidatus Muproteobacteria bacterium RIFCSPHIGHO2_02_FULL_65_16]